MTVLVNNFIVENEHYTLFTDSHKGLQYWGSIPHTEMEKGKLKRKLNGLEMCISFDSFNDALKKRVEDVRIKKLLQFYKSQGMTIEDALYKIYVTDVFNNMEAAQ